MREVRTQLDLEETFMHDRALEHYLISSSV
jgi:hypothetical protein